MRLLPFLEQGPLYDQISSPQTFGARPIRRSTCPLGTRITCPGARSSPLSCAHPIPKVQAARKTPSAGCSYISATATTSVGGETRPPEAPLKSGPSMRTGPFGIRGSAEFSQAFRTVRVTRLPCLKSDSGPGTEGTMQGGRGNKTNPQPSTTAGLLARSLAWPSRAPTIITQAA